MTAYGGSRGIRPLILNLRSRWSEWSTSCHDRFTLGERSPGPIELGAAWTPEPVRTPLVRKKHICCIFREQKQASPVILQRSLVCLRYPVRDSLVFHGLLIDILSGE
jgi:hypothetical protein